MSSARRRSTSNQRSRLDLPSLAIIERAGPPARPKTCGRGASIACRPRTQKSRTRRQRDRFLRLGAGRRRRQSNAAGLFHYGVVGVAMFDVEGCLVATTSGSMHRRNLMSNRRRKLCPQSSSSPSAKQRSWESSPGAPSSQGRSSDVLTYPRLAEAPPSRRP